MLILKIIIIAVLTWPIAGVAGYWLAVLFDRITGLGMALPSMALARRHPLSQIISGWIFFLDVALSIPFTWAYREDMKQSITPANKDSLPGIAVAGMPANENTGWYKIKYVPGATSYREARKQRDKALWINLKDIALDAPDFTIARQEDFE